MAYPSGKFRHGKNGRTIVDGATLANTSWSAKENGDKAPTDNFESDGFHESLLGFQGLDWSIAGNWNAAVNNYDDPPGLYVRDNGESIDLYPNNGEIAQFQMPYWACYSSNMTCSATAVVSIDSGGESQGEYSLPTGSISG